MSGMKVDPMVEEFRREAYAFRHGTVKNADRVNQLAQVLTKRMESDVSTEQLFSDEQVLFDVLHCYEASDSADDFIRRILNMNLVVRRKAPVPDDVTEDGDVIP